MNLSDTKPGQLLRIVSIDDPDAESQMIRMGLASGDMITCLTRLPAGPTVVKCAGVEVALGRELAQKIRVEVA